MICFQKCIFVVLETTIFLIWHLYVCCDLLSKMYLCRIGNNKRKWSTITFVVVICFQKCIFVVLETTKFWRFRHWCVVICFQKCIFVVLETTYYRQSQSTMRCDLLSKMYLCRIGNNWSNLAEQEETVVICFQKCIFVVLETTLKYSSFFSLSLWFAFKNVSLSYWKQRWNSSGFTIKCCDLLSKMYLCRIGNNIKNIFKSL